MDLATQLSQIDLTNENQQQQLLHCYERCKDDPKYIEYACQALQNDQFVTQHQVTFFLLLILENHVKKLDTTDAIVSHENIKVTLERSSRHGTAQPGFLANKTAQVLALAFAKLYPVQWPDFFPNLITAGPSIFLRTLSQIDGEVVNRRIHHTKRELDRNTRLKDEMREKDVAQLVKSWREILEQVSEQKLTTDIGNLCLEVIGQYVEWIDINLIANDAVMANLFNLLKRPDLCDAVCDCLCEIVQKGMPPKEKCVLVESLYQALKDAGLFTVENDENLESIAKLVSALGCELLHQNEKFGRLDGETESANNAIQAAERKLQLALRLLEHEDNDISVETVEFVQLFVDRSRHADYKMSDEYLSHIIRATVGKMRYSDDYNFDRPGQDEAEYDDFVNELKTIFESCCLSAPLLVLSLVNERLGALNDQIPFRDAELTIRLLYNLGECLPGEFGPQKFNSENPSELQKLFGSFVTCAVPQHHSVVRLTLETLVRYDKFFQHDKTSLGSVLEFIVGPGGLLHSHGSVRSRAAYLFSRIVRELHPLMPNYAADLLRNLQKVLYEGDDEFLSESDRSFVFEAAGYLVTAAPINAENKGQLYRELLSPLVARFQADIKSLVETQLEPDVQSVIATRASQYVAWAGRTTKCWKGPENVDQCRAQPILGQTLQLFISALRIPQHVTDRTIVLQSIRTFLHRMLICLGTDVLVLLPHALKVFLDNVDFRELHELYPLINQVASKFKGDAAELLATMLPSILQNSFLLMETGDPEEDKIMRRDFFNFLNGLCNNGLIQIFMVPENQADLPRVIQHLESGARGGDPVAAKICFMVLTKLSKQWATKYPEFGNIILQTIIPACFLGPMGPEYDLKDAQTQMAIVEAANCMKALFEISGHGLITYLCEEYLPTLNMDQSVISEYCEALATKDIKAFRGYVKIFFGRSHNGAS